MRNEAGSCTTKDHGLRTKAEPSGVGVGGEVRDHIPDGLVDRGLPAVSEPGKIGRTLIGEGEPPRAVDQGAQAILIECGGDVARRGSLGTVTRYEEEDAGES